MDDGTEAVTKILVLSLSASEPSVGRRCVSTLQAAVTTAGAIAEVKDIRDLPPVWVDKRDLEKFPALYADLYAAVEASDGVVMVLPIHCYTMSGSAKSISEIIGDALAWKPVALVTAAGSHRSYLAARDLMASMMFEQRTICYPATVQATEDMLLPEGSPGEDLRGRLERLASGFVAFVGALKSFAAEQVPFEERE